MYWYFLAEEVQVFIYIRVEQLSSDGNNVTLVFFFCDQVLVMNNGRIEEQNDADELLENPKSTYTKRLEN